MGELSSNRLLLRAFTKDDFSDILTLAGNWKASPGPEWDKFPADEKFLDEICTHNNFFAVYLCENEKVIGLLAINGIDDNKRLDLGHVIHSDFQNNDIDREALGMMIEHIFTKMDVKTIITENYPDEKQVAPLKSLGFTYTEGCSSYCQYELTKNKWEKIKNEYKSKNYCT
jgi:RimJ/RimL family protein N-acetyltransferase